MTEVAETTEALGSGTRGSASGVDMNAFAKLHRRMTNPWLMRLFMLFKMPLGFVAGLRVARLDTEQCQTTVPYGWRTTNPFRSTYFAALSMAAELSTGALAMAATELTPGSTSMLIIGMEAEFGKKATARTTFTCDDGAAIFGAVHDATASGSSATVSRHHDRADGRRYGSRSLCVSHGLSRDGPSSNGPSSSGLLSSGSGWHD